MRIWRLLNEELSSNPSKIVLDRQIKKSNSPNLFILYFKHRMWHEADHVK